MLSTGFGKSLCFQLPAAAGPGGVTIVVTPLVALAKDQQSDLEERGVDAAMWSSSQDAAAKESIRFDLTEVETPETRLLYATPEGLQTEALQQVVSSLHERGLLRAFAIDEAHCVSQVGGPRPRFAAARARARARPA